MISFSYRIPFQVLRKPAQSSTTMADQSNQDPRRTQCSNEQMFDLESQSCCSPGLGCQSSQVTHDLTGYAFYYKTDITNTGQMTIFHSLYIHVVEGDIIAVQPHYHSGGRLAKLNKTRSTTTALMFNLSGTISSSSTFQSIGVPVATRDLFAFRAIVVSTTNYEMKHSFTKVGTFVMNIKLQSPMRALMHVLSSKSVHVQEKVHSVNVSIPKLGLVNRVSVFNIEALGTDLAIQVSFGDGVTQTFSSGQPIQHQYSLKGVFNVSVRIYNKVSLYWVDCQYETIMPVENVTIAECFGGIVYKPFLPITTVLPGGDFVNISTTFHNGGEEYFFPNVSIISGPVNKTINHSFPHPDAYAVTAFATNGLSNSTILCILFVEIPIQGLNMSNISSFINVEHNISLALAAQGGSNVTYKGMLNGKPINITCDNHDCSQAGVLLITGTYPIGTHNLRVCVRNHVTLMLCRTAIFTAIQLVSGTSLLVQNAYLVNEVARASVVFHNGSHASCFLEIQGHQGMQQQCQAGLAMTKSITCATPGFFKVLANCSNALSFEYKESNFTCMHPVRQIVLTSDSPQSTLDGTVNFTLSHVAPVPSNATCNVSFGNGFKTVFEDCFLPLNFSHK